jgi:hypothetical protein
MRDIRNLQEQVGTESIFGLSYYLSEQGKELPMYALDKKLKIDSDIVDMLADVVGKSSEDIAKELSKETVGYYDKFQNVIG